MEIIHFSIVLHGWFIIKDRRNIGSTKLMLKKKRLCAFWFSGKWKCLRLLLTRIFPFSVPHCPPTPLTLPLHSSFYLFSPRFNLHPPLPFPARVYTSWRKRTYSGHIIGDTIMLPAAEEGLEWVDPCPSTLYLLLILFSLDSLLWKFFFFLPLSRFFFSFCSFSSSSFCPLLTHSPPPLPVQSLPATVLLSFREVPSLRGGGDLFTLSSACDGTPELSASSGNPHIENAVEEHGVPAFLSHPLIGYAWRLRDSVMK